MSTFEHELFGDKKTLWFCSECTKEQEEIERKISENSQAFERQNRINMRLENAMIAPRFSEKVFDNFRLDNLGQKKALDAARMFLEHLKSVGMIFTGKPGTGKNHLASAIVREAIMKHSKTALITTAMKMLRAIKDSWKGGSEKEIIRSFVDPDILVIDEVGVQFGSDTEKLYLTEIINERYEWLKATLILTNLTISELGKTLGERIIDRFKEGGCVIVFDWESYRGKYDAR